MYIQFLVANEQVANADGARGHLEVRSGQVRRVVGKSNLTRQQKVLVHLTCTLAHSVLHSLCQSATILRTIRLTDAILKILSSYHTILPQTMSTLAEYLVSQQSLLQEASLALPHSFSTCTYRLGPIRQPLYLCTTCASPRGICAACSVACHTDHEQIELFAKRNFTCDCPTKGLAHPCSLHRNPVGEGGKEEVNAGNEYGGNFEGKFCRCGREYDAATERETMVQCLACEVCSTEVAYWHQV